VPQQHAQGHGAGGSRDLNNSVVGFCWAREAFPQTFSGPASRMLPAAAAISHSRRVFVPRPSKLSSPCPPESRVETPGMGTRGPIRNPPFRARARACSVDGKRTEISNSISSPREFPCPFFLPPSSSFDESVINAIRRRHEFRVHSRPRFAFPRISREIQDAVGSCPSVLLVIPFCAVEDSQRPRHESPKFLPVKRPRDRIDAEPRHGNLQITRFDGIDNIYRIYRKKSSQL